MLSLRTLRLPHLLWGLMLVILNVFVILHQNFRVIHTHIPLVFITNYLLQLLFFIRLAMAYPRWHNLIIFYIVLFVPQWFAQIINPVLLNGEKPHNSQEILLLWAAFLLANVLLCAITLFARVVQRFQQQLRYERELYDSIIQAIPIPIAVHKRDDSTPVINSSAHEMVDILVGQQQQHDTRSKDTVTNAVILRWVHSLWARADSNTDASSTMNFQRYTNSSHGLFEVGYNLLDVSVPPYLTSDNPDDDAHLLIFGVDIGERELLMQALTRAKEAAEKNNQAKTDFLANVSHELRTPITSIVGFSQLISTREGLYDDVADMAQTITRNGESLLALVNDVLDLSKAEADSLTLFEKEVSLSSMVFDEMNNFHMQLEEKGLRFELRMSFALPRALWVDEGKVRQVLRNLLSNAIKFTQTGTIRLHIWSSNLLNWQSDTPPFASLEPEAIASKKAMAASILPRNRKEVVVHFEVHDTGVGIEKDALESIFDPFTQSRSGISSQKGTGLGLTISKKYAEFLGGDLRMESTLGQGTRCHFYVRARLEPKPTA